MCLAVSCDLDGMSEVTLRACRAEGSRKLHQQVTLGPSVQSFLVLPLAFPEGKAQSHHLEGLVPWWALQSTLAPHPAPSTSDSWACRAGGEKTYCQGNMCR